MKEIQGGIFLGLGSNLGDRKENINNALIYIKKHPNIDIIRYSLLYRSEPWGVTDQPWFLNTVCEIETHLKPSVLLKELKKIEREIGRMNSSIRWGPRVIDIDIILYRNIVIDTEELTIPHKHSTERLFVLIPLLEISPDVVHPVNNTPFHQYLEKLQSESAKQTCLPYHPTV
jgi:2-amino-4-hydroxy-6-hydroxymethyldihydropteridine diphosphokinase